MNLIEEKPNVLGYIHGQPRALMATYNNRSEFLNPFKKIFENKKIKKILFFGSGTSYNVSHIAAYYFKHIVGVDASANYPTVFQNYENADWTHTLKNDEILFFGISQSGTSISTVNMMKAARAKGYITCALTEDLNSEITHHVDTVIHLLCGKELTPPETRGYTVSLLQMYLLAYEVALTIGKINQEQYGKGLANAEILCKDFETVVQESEAWYDRNATSIVNSNRIYVLGYGIDYGSALEGMLKIGEMLRLPALGYELEEYAHGPTMAINAKETIIMIGSDEVEWNRCLQFREAFKQYTPRVYLLSYKDVEHSSKDCIFSIKTNKYLAPIMFTVPLQFVAAKGAEDTDIDTGVNPFKIKLSHLSVSK